ncbi:hypothetical protein VTN00DRAFT_7685 [Thermoascus crustaceus]|uniref:uncharacterized protein n=1 Tax=Thermoascus crustaceus TaxID=5088 RepID=UPI003743CAC3
MAVLQDDSIVKLSLSESICGIILLWIVYYIGCAVYALYFHPLRKFPGPKFAAISHLPFIYWECTGVLQFQIKRLHDQYGSVVRIGPDKLTYRAPQAWKDIYGHRKSGEGAFLKDHKFYFPAVNGSPTIINANEADHSRIRRLLAHAFSDRALREQETLLRSYVDLLVDRLHAQVTGPSQGVVDMVKWYSYVTFDIIGDLSFGEPFNCLEDGRFHPWLTLFQSIRAQPFLRIVRSYPIITPIFNMLVKGLKQKRAEHFQFGVGKLNRRMQKPTERPDFMSYILRHNDEKGMTKPEIEATVSILILAGSETTATLLSGCTYYLLKNPDMYRKLVDEIRGTFANEGDINIISIAKLPYLHAVLEESLRIYPPVPSIFPRLVPEGGAVIDNQFVPGGTSVSVAPWSTFHAESNFTEPESFLPERWLDNSSSPEFGSDCRDAMQAFSFGPRNCLGKNLAYAEMRLILTKVLWHFDLELRSESSDWNQQKAYILWQKPDLMVKLTPVRGRTD